MQTKAMFLSLIILGTLFISCEKENLKIVPSNNVSSQQHDISDFDELDISDPFNVYVTFDENEQTLRIEANDNLHSVIEVEQKNGKLSIELEKNTSIKNGEAVLNVFLTTNNIETIRAQGAAHIQLQNQWNVEQAEIELTGASSFRGTLSADQLYTNLLGASNLDIQGTANVFEIEAEGASNMIDFDFETNELTADLRGASNVSVTVHDKLNVDAEGASTVYYKGNGIIKNQSLSGGSQIIKVE